MNFRVVFLEQKVVPVAALVHDQAVAALQEPAATKAIRIGPLKGGPGAVTEQSYRGGRRKRYLKNVSRWNPAMAVRPTTGCKWDLIIDGVLGVQRGDTPASPALKRDSHCSTVSRADISTVYRANRCDGNRIDRQTHPGLTKPGDHRRNHPSLESGLLGLAKSGYLRASICPPAAPATGVHGLRGRIRLQRGGRTF